MSGPPADEEGRSLKPFILLLAAIVVVAAVIAVTYSVQQRGQPQQSLTFSKRDDLAGKVNATVLAYADVHKHPALQDRLDRALEFGNASETVTLLIDQLRGSLQEVTRETGPVWYVKWADSANVDHVIQVTWVGG